VFRFFAVPAWQLIESDHHRGLAPSAASLSPALGLAPIASVLGRAEYRGGFALARAQQLLAEAAGPAVYARPPNDLPALLRTADQLQSLARQDAGEPAYVWRCECGARYAVPATLLRPVAFRCDRCDRTVDFDSQRSAEVAPAADPALAQVGAARQALAEFFREAMFLGWPVLVERR
jgi:hypothetical protein